MICTLVTLVLSFHQFANLIANRECIFAPIRIWVERLTLCKWVLAESFHHFEIEFYDNPFRIYGNVGDRCFRNKTFEINHCKILLKLIWRPVNSELWKSFIDGLLLNFVSQYYFEIIQPKLLYATWNQIVNCMICYDSSFFIL